MVGRTVEPVDPEVAGDVAARKAALRAAARAARRQLRPGERAEASEALVDRLLPLPELSVARAVLLYAALDEEVDLAGAVGPLQARGLRICFPRVDGQRLLAVEAADPRTLQAGFRGIHEPSGPAIHPSAIGVVVLPGVAFDPHGGRLGRGGGHYDRLLSELPDGAHRVGVCFACQVVPDVPREAHDQVVDVVVSDRAVYRTGARVR